MSDEKYRIWSFEHDAWWRPNWYGYTENIEEAGIYEEKVAHGILFDANLFGKINEEMRPVTNAA